MTSLNILERILNTGVSVNIVKRDNRYELSMHGNNHSIVVSGEDFDSCLLSGIKTITVGFFGVEVLAHGKLD